MKFKELDEKIRKYENSLDFCILPELYLAARLDGRGFTKLTKEICQFEAPFDERFRDCMVKTALHLMDCGFNVLYAYTESDEISLLFSPEENTFGRKTRKFNSVLAGEASAAFTKELGVLGVFDCRVIPLPAVECVKDYFLWRQEDAHRNSLNSWCYWTMRKENADPQEADAAIKGKSVSWKNEFLFNKGINYNDLPSWQKRGLGLYYEDYEKESVNPLTGEIVTAVRRRIKKDYELPVQEQYAMFIENLLTENTE